MLLASAVADTFSIFLVPETWQVTGRTLLVSVSATVIAMTFGLIAAAALLEARGRVAKFFDALVSAFVAIPAVVIGLVALMIFTSTPFAGSRITLSLLPMILAQGTLLLPLATTLMLSVLRERHALLGEEMRSLGVGAGARFDALLMETWPHLAAVSILVFSRGIAEVGVVLILGGNIEGRTQVLTTLIAEQARLGQYELAAGLALILIVLAFVLTLIVRSLQART